MILKLRTNDCCNDTIGNSKKISDIRNDIEVFKFNIKYGTQDYYTVYYHLK